jgi:hypothetical protein
MPDKLINPYYNREPSSSKHKKISSTPSASVTKQRKHKSSSMEDTPSTAGVSASSKLSKSSGVAHSSVSQTESNPTHQELDAHILNQQANNLRSMATWIPPHENLQHHQHPSNLYNTNSPPCPYHTSLEHGTTISRYDLTPTERWLAEDIGDGGMLALQMGYQLRVGCTCIVLPDCSAED